MELREAENSRRRKIQPPVQDFLQENQKNSYLANQFSCVPLIGSKEFGLVSANGGSKIDQRGEKRRRGNGIAGMNRRKCEYPARGGVNFVSHGKTIEKGFSNSGFGCVWVEILAVGPYI